MRRADNAEMDRCPKAYLKWSFVVVGMVFVFLCYLVYTNVMVGIVSSGVATPTERTPTVVQAPTVRTGGDEGASPSASAFGAQNIIRTEHINEEDGYEKPVCKRLEESGER